MFPASELNHLEPLTKPRGRTMVDFVRPKFLGTKKRFKDLYSIPIKAGVMSDAPMSDVRHAKRRTFALAKKLEKFVQRKVRKGSTPNETQA
jgi:SNF2 family DNA or RNA helicase